jgi:hypothetical protein
MPVAFVENAPKTPDSRRFNWHLPPKSQPMPVIIHGNVPETPDSRQFNWHLLPKSQPVPVIFLRNAPETPNPRKSNWHLFPKSQPDASYYCVRSAPTRACLTVIMRTPLSDHDLIVLSFN